MDTIHEVIARCVDPDCQCLDRAGVILYRGPDQWEAERAARDLAPRGYEVSHKTVASTP